MKKLSLVMISKNEESKIRRCLESVENIVDEIIIVDTGSNDKTKDILDIWIGESEDAKFWLSVCND